MKRRSEELRLENIVGAMSLAMVDSHENTVTWIGRLMASPVCSPLIGPSPYPRRR